MSLTILGRLAAESKILLPELLAALEEETLEMLEDAPAQSDRYTSVRASFQLTYKFLQEHHPSAASCFARMGVFAARRSFVDMLDQVVLPDVSFAKRGKIRQILVRFCLLSILESDAGAGTTWKMHHLVHRFAREKFAALDDETRDSLRMQHAYRFYALGEDIAQTAGRGRREQNRVIVAFDDVAQAIETLLELKDLPAALRLFEDISLVAADAGLGEETDALLTRLEKFAEDNDLMRWVEIRGFLKLRRAWLLALKYQWKDAFRLADEVRRDDDYRDDMSEEERLYLMALLAEAAILSVIANAMLGDARSSDASHAVNAIERALGLQPSEELVGMPDYQAEFVLEDAEMWLSAVGNAMGNEESLRAQLLQAKGEQALAQKMYRDALAYFSEAVQKSTAAGNMWLAQLCSMGQANTLFELGEVKQARELLQKLLDTSFVLERPHYEAKLLLALCFEKEGRRKAAVRVLRAIDTEIRDRPEFRAQRAQALSILGRMLCGEGDVEEGKEKLLEAKNLWKSVPYSENQQRQTAEWLNTCGKDVP